MKEFVVNKSQQNSRLDSYLKHILRDASDSFIYKMLRKKNITVNDSKKEGSYRLNNGDIIKIYFSDETFDLLSKSKDSFDLYYSIKDIPCDDIDIVYEDYDIIAVNKGKNVLSQKSKDTDISINEKLISYMINTNQLSKESFKTVRPSVVNRLDRNTTGIVLFGKSQKGLRNLSSDIKNNRIKKYYSCILNGRGIYPGILESYLKKDNHSNKVDISKNKRKDYQPIVTEIIDIYENDDNLTLSKILLHTGKTHQIRAHMAFIGHPVIGDNKYGNKDINEFYKIKYGISSQMLHCNKVKLSNNIEIRASLPREFDRVFH